MSRRRKGGAPAETAAPTMREELNVLRQYDRPQDRIRQHRQADQSPVLVVEGVDDLRVLEDHLVGVTIFPVGGKPPALAVTAALEGWGIQGFLCLIDHDFDGFPNPGKAGHRLRVYPKRDLEGWLVDIGVLASLLKHHSSSAKVDVVGGVKVVVEECKEAASPVTNLRKINAARQLGLAFDEVDLSSKVDLRTGKVDVDSYLESLRSASDTRRSYDEVREWASEVCDDGRGPRGKDVVEIAGVHLRKRLASLPHQAVGVDLMCANLRSGAALAVATDDWFIGFCLEVRNLSEELGLGVGGPP